jgi:hypothetical protein
MAETKETNSTSKEGFGQPEFKFCCGDSEEMSRMIRNFCSGEDKTFDCRAMMQMMQKMCCAAPEKSGRQESSDS